MVYALRSKGDAFLKQQDENTYSRGSRVSSTAVKIALCSFALFAALYAFNFREHYNLGFEKGQEWADKFVAEQLKNRALADSKCVIDRVAYNLTSCVTFFKNYLLSNK